MERTHWSSRWECIAVVLARIVNIGCLWRFPYLWLKNGGLAFLVPYGTMLLFLAFPLLLLEHSFGQVTQSSAITAWRSNKPWIGIGIASTVVTFYSCMQTAVQLSWIIYYFLATFYPAERKLASQSIHSSRFPWSTCGNFWNEYCCYESQHHEDLLRSRRIKNNCSQYFNPRVQFWELNVLGMGETQNTVVKTSANWPLMIIVCSIWMVASLVLVNRTRFLASIYVLLTITVFVLGVLAAGAFSLTDKWHGLSVIFEYYQADDMWRRSAWFEAAVYTIWSTGICFSTHTTLGGYNRKDTGLITQSFCFVVIAALASLFCASIVFCLFAPTLAKTGVPIELLVKSGPSLVFDTLLDSLESLWAAPLWIALLFLVLISMGLSTHIITFKCLVDSIHDAGQYALGKRLPKTSSVKRTDRKVSKVGYRAVLLALSGLGIVLGILMTVPHGIYMFAVFDFYATNALVLLIVGFAQCLGIGLWPFRHWDQYTAYVGDSLWVTKLFSLRLAGACAAVVPVVERCARVGAKVFPLLWVSVCPLICMIGVIQYLSNFPVLKLRFQSKPLEIFEYPKFTLALGILLLLSSLLCILGGLLHYCFLRWKSRLNSRESYQLSTTAAEDTLSGRSDNILKRN